MPEPELTCLASRDVAGRTVESRCSVGALRLVVTCGHDGINHEILRTVRQHVTPQALGFVRQRARALPVADWGHVAVGPQAARALGVDVAGPLKIEEGDWDVLLRQLPKDEKGNQ